MSFEAIDSIKKAEEEAQETIASAGAEAKAMIAKAQDEGENALEGAKALAASEKATLFSKIEEQIKKEEAEALAKSAAATDTLRVKATAHMDEAVNLIIERIVKA